MSKQAIARQYHTCTINFASRFFFHSFLSSSSFLIRTACGAPRSEHISSTHSKLPLLVLIARCNRFSSFLAISFSVVKPVPSSDIILNKPVSETSLHNRRNREWCVARAICSLYLLIAVHYEVSEMQSSSLVTAVKNILSSSSFAAVEHTIFGIVLWSLIRRIRRNGLKSVLNELISGFLASTGKLTKNLIANTMKDDASKAVVEMFKPYRTEGVKSLSSE